MSIKGGFLKIAKNFGKIEIFYKKILFLQINSVTSLSEIR